MGFAHGLAGPFARRLAVLRQRNLGAALGHATLVEAALLAHDLVLPALSDDARERNIIWSEARLYAALFGIPLDSLAPDWKSFMAYREAMTQIRCPHREPCAATSRDRYSPEPRRKVKTPLWYRAPRANAARPIADGVQSCRSEKRNVAVQARAQVDAAHLSPAPRSAAHGRSVSGGAQARMKGSDRLSLRGR